LNKNGGKANPFNELVNGNYKPITGGKSITNGGREDKETGTSGGVGLLKSRRKVSVRSEKHLGGR